MCRSETTTITCLLAEPCFPLTWGLGLHAGAAPLLVNGPQPLQDVDASGTTHGTLAAPVEPELQGSMLGKQQASIDAVHDVTSNMLTKCGLACLLAWHWHPK